MKKANKKQSYEYGLEQNSFPKHKRWMVDQDYSDQLTEEEKQWLGKFNQEYYRNSFTQEPIHNTPELKRACYNTENARNRDLHSIAATNNAIQSDIIVGEDGKEESIYNLVADISLSPLKSKVK